MAQSKALNKNSFYGQSQGVGKPHIEMPPIPEEQVSTEQVSAEPKQEQQAQSSDNPIEVPEEVPKEVDQEMAAQANQGDNVQDTSPAQEPKKEEYKPAAHDSFKSLRDAKEKAEKERDALLQQFLQSQTQQPTKEAPQVEIDDNIDFDIDEDGLVEGRYVKKVTNKLKSIEAQIKNYKTQQQLQTTEAKIKAQFPDFDKVVSEENVYMLNEQFPEIAQTLKDTPDLYNKAASAYNIMKRFGIYKENTYQPERQKAEDNLKKPRPLTSASPQQGDSPLSHANAFANGLTPELKKQLNEEMFAARKKI